MKVEFLLLLILYIQGSVAATGTIVYSQVSGWNKETVQLTTESHKITLKKEDYLYPIKVEYCLSKRIIHTKKIIKMTKHSQEIKKCKNQ